MSQQLQRSGCDVIGVSRDRVRKNDQPYEISSINLADRDRINDLVGACQPEEIYYLAAHHTSSEGIRELSGFHSEFLRSQEVHVTGLLNFLSAIVNLNSKSKLFYASSSLVFSGEDGEVQDELTPLRPQGIYGITKAQGMWLCREFRARQGVFASAGILYNHESSLRPAHFLTTRVIHTAMRISAGSEEQLEIGDLSSRVDWGYAADYVSAFRSILALAKPEDFIVASGEAHTVEEFVGITFNYFGLNVNEYVVSNPELLQRRQPVKIGNPEKLKRLTAWQPSRNFGDFVVRLIEDHIAADGSNKAGTY